MHLAGEWNQRTHQHRLTALRAAGPSALKSVGRRECRERYLKERSELEIHKPKVSCYNVAEVMLTC
jgi:hypothetical protein